MKIGRTIFKFIAGGNIEAAYHDEIYRLTTMDGLTQVHNRRYFDEQLDRELSRSRRYERVLSLVMLDIDHFKQINDRTGTWRGTTVLKQLASTVRTRIRREDVFARYGGEEFAIILPEIDLKSARQFAEKVRQLVEKQQFSVRQAAHPGDACRWAWRCWSREHREAADLVRAADEKLYEAKTSGRNRVRC